ncbi:methyl-accepting chemotaxis protein [Falsiroseomonas ponticola]|uniref:methyl-accepting chemotaxis protein n=1 Tax=Falsiroseomonas ponticola TaxID=2786951 RepID=UPI001933CAAE|nr:methyl-accepting chemotaxis protein [Roseomonas ponticola]
MRIKVLFTLVMAGIAGLGGTIATVAGLDQWQNRREAADAVRTTEAAATLMRLTERLVIERGNYVIRMNASGAAEADTVGRLTAIKADTDAALAPAIASLRASGAGRAHAERLQAAIPVLAELRRAMDPAAVLPLAQRDPAIRGRPQAVYDQVLGHVTAALNDSHRILTRADGPLGDLMLVARLTWDLRDQASRRIVAIATALNSGRAMTPAELDTANGASRLVEATWARVKMVAGLIDDTPRLSAAIAEVEDRYFGDITRQTQALIDAGRAGSTYPLSSNAFTAFATPGLQVLLQVRDAALAEAAAHAAMAESRAAALLAIVLAAALVVGLVLAGLGWLLVRRVVVPVVRLTGVVQRLAQGDNAVAVPDQARQDEIGAMADAVEVLRRNAVQAAKVAAEAAAEQQAKAARADATQALVRRFEAEVADVLGAVAGAAAPLDETASRMGDAASGARAQADAMTRAVDTTASHTQTVANSAEELAASIAEVAQQVTQSARLAQQASRDAQESNQAVAGLADVASRIGDVIGLINSIAGQTNLLALNATIEAARAGDAGKGFAVVAGEVKALAAQTATATEQISTQIAAMQAETSRAVAAIRGIGQTIEELSSIATQVAAAAEQQSAATQEIGRAIAQTAASTQELTAQTAQAREGAETTYAASAGLRDASAGLSRQADVLRAKVDGFLAEIRRAA